MALAGLESRWGRFLFGGLAILLITQLHGVPFKRWQKLAITAVCVGGAAWYYTLRPETLPGLGRGVVMHYVAVAIVALLIWLIMRPFISRGRRQQQPA